MLKPRRITRRELKEDRLVLVMAQIESIFRNYRQQVMYGVVGLAVLVGAAVYWYHQQQVAEITAQAAEGEAGQHFVRANYEGALEKYLAVVDTHPGTEAGARATYMLGNTYYQLGNYDEAERYYRRYQDDYSDDDVFAAGSLSGIAACMEERQQYPEAAEQYARAARTYPDVFNAPDILLSAARCYRLAGRMEEARASCRQVIDEYPTSIFVNDAEMFLALL